MTDQPIVLDRNPWPRAADFMEEVGFTKGSERNERGQVCAEGAVRYCTPQQGDGVIWREVLNRRGKGASFNDDPSTTKDDVLTYFRTAEPITDDELADVFGPQWEAVVALIRKAATLTPADRRAYWSAVDARRELHGETWWDAYGAVVVGGGGPGFAALRALRAFVVGDGAAVGSALARRHEIGTAFTQGQYDLLCAPWVELHGTVHPDDQRVEVQA